MIEATIEREPDSIQIMKKVDKKIEVRATDHQEFLKNLHQTPMQEIPIILDPLKRLDHHVMTINQENS